MSLKFTGELYVMADAKFEEELTCQFKIDMRNLTNFDLSTQKSQKFEEFRKFSSEHVRKSKNWDFDGILLSKVENVGA